MRGFSNYASQQEKFEKMNKRQINFTTISLFLMFIYCAYLNFQLFSHQKEFNEFQKKYLSTSMPTIHDTKDFDFSKPVFAMPSVVIATPVLIDPNNIYGGNGDLPHLGGFIYRDNNTISENVWNYILGPIAAKSIIDLGCGKGYSARYFLDKGAKVLCVEGSHDAVMQSLLPPEVIVEHDFTRGPWWPEETFDIAWSTEFLEHVGRQYMRNYMPIFQRSALIFVTSSGWGGHHHVEVHGSWWWISRFEAQGFVYSERLSKIISHQAKLTPRSHGHHAQSLLYLNVFINPKVASLHKHDHLFGGNGCFNGVNDNRDGGIACEGVDALPSKYISLVDCKKGVTNEMTDLDDALWKCTSVK